MCLISKTIVCENKIIQIVTISTLKISKLNILTRFTISFENYWVLKNLSSMKIVLKQLILIALKNLKNILLIA